MPQSNQADAANFKQSKRQAEAAKSAKQLLSKLGVAEDSEIEILDDDYFDFYIIGYSPEELRRYLDRNKAEYQIVPAIEVLRSGLEQAGQRFLEGDCLGERPEIKSRVIARYQLLFKKAIAVGDYKSAYACNKAISDIFDF